MIDLVAKSPADGVQMLSLDGVELSELALGKVTSIAPLQGKMTHIEEQLEIALPKVGRSVGKAGREIVWFSQGQYLAIGCELDDGLSDTAAITDQSDAWCALQLKGPLSEAILARLVPVDLRSSSFKRGHVLRSQLGHMPLHITRTGKDAFRLMSFRSMASTMVHEISRAMTVFAARG